MCAARARELYEQQAKERQGKRNDIKENFPECQQARDAAGKAFGVSCKSVDFAVMLRSMLNHVGLGIFQSCSAVIPATFRKCSVISSAIVVRDKKASLRISEALLAIGLF